MFVVVAGAGRFERFIGNRGWLSQQSEYHIIISLLLRIEDLVATFVLLGITTNGPSSCPFPAFANG
jgi:hypothetical protein